MQECFPTFHNLDATHLREYAPTNSWNEATVARSDLGVASSEIDNWNASWSTVTKPKPLTQEIFLGMLLGATCSHVVQGYGVCHSQRLASSSSVGGCCRCSRSSGARAGAGAASASSGGGRAPSAGGGRRRKAARSRPGRAGAPERGAGGGGCVLTSGAESKATAGRNIFPVLKSGTADVGRKRLWNSLNTRGRGRRKRRRGLQPSGEAGRAEGLWEAGWEMPQRERPRAWLLSSLEPQTWSWPHRCASAEPCWPEEERDAARRAPESCEVQAGVRSAGAGEVRPPALGKKSIAWLLDPQTVYVGGFFASVILWHTGQPRLGVYCFLCGLSKMLLSVYSVSACI